jgi:hypothetical protein
MRQSDVNRKLFSAGHYNIIAKKFRESLESCMEIPEARVAVSTLAYNLAIRLQADNIDFDGVRFLTACTPDPVRLNLAEMWDWPAGEDPEVQDA